MTFPIWQSHIDQHPRRRAPPNRDIGGGDGIGDQSYLRQAIIGAQRLRDNLQRALSSKRGLANDLPSGGINRRMRLLSCRLTQGVQPRRVARAVTRRAAGFSVERSGTSPEENPVEAML